MKQQQTESKLVQQTIGSNTGVYAQNITVRELQQFAEKEADLQVYSSTRWFSER